MRLIKLITAAFCTTGVFLCTYIQAADCNDISAYYGFGEMEVVKLDWGIENLNIADFNGDGRNDIAIVNNRKSNIELLVQKQAVGPDEPQVAVDANDIDINQIIPPIRFEKQNVAVSQKIFSLVTGDLNSDGMTDLAFYGEPKGLYVLLQKKDEAEKNKSKVMSWRTRKKIKIDDGLLTSNALVCCDINNDGAKDLIMAGQDNIYIILQQKGGDSPAEAVKYPTSALTLSVEIADLNGDKINDLVIVTNDDEKPIHVRFGLKDGQLGPEVRFFVETPFALQLKDIDGDANDEILTIDSRGGRLICYKFTSEKEISDDWPIVFYPLAGGDENTKRDLVIGDFDGNGLIDVIISDPDAAELVFYKQMPLLGLAEPARFPAFAAIDSLSAADTDGDKKQEIGVLSIKEKVIGIAEFENDRLSFPRPLKIAGEPSAMELADIDRNGSTDCVYVSKDANDIRSLRVYYDLEATVKSGGKKPEKSGKDSSVLELKNLASNPDGLKVMDVDQDGLQDVLIFVRYEQPVLIRQIQKGKFEIIDSPNQQASLIKDASLSSVAAANVDEKSGDELLIAQNNFARSLLFTGGESWNIIDQYNAKNTENKISAVAAFDIDQKGNKNRPSVLLLDSGKGQLQILKAGEDKIYRFEKELNVGKWNAAAHLKMLYAPLAGSTVKNILIFDGEKFSLMTPPVTGSIQQRLEQQFIYETKIKNGVYGNIAAGDINSDGKTDIVMLDYNQNHIEILTFDSKSNLIPAMRFKVFERKVYRDGKTSDKYTSVEPREIKIADVTGDGKNDLVTVIHDRIIIYPQD